MPVVSRIGDQGSHGGTYIGAITTGNNYNITANNLSVATVGSSYSCPEHGAQTITTGISSVLLAGKEVATIGSVVSCGATITQGSPNVIA
jgi:uncharacterized Zn-binding protein involved in type VI secretion